MDGRTAHIRGAHGPAGQSGHIEAHNAIANHLNGHNPCPLCRVLVADDEAAQHRRSHIGRAIAAR